MTKVEKAAVKKLERCIVAMLAAEKALRPIHPDKADEIKGAAGIAEEWVDHISGGSINLSKLPPHAENVSIKPLEFDGV